MMIALKIENEKLKAEVSMLREELMKVKKKYVVELDSHKKCLKRIQQKQEELEESTEKDIQIESLRKLFKESQKKLQVTEQQLKDLLTKQETTYTKKVHALEDELITLKKQLKIKPQHNVNLSLDEVLSMGKAYLNAIHNLEHLTTKEKLEQLKRLVRLLIEENNQTKAKYNKLLDLHNQLIGLNKKGEIFSKAKLVEENETLKWKLNAMHQQYE